MSSKFIISECEEDSGINQSVEDESVPVNELPVLDDSLQDDDPSFYRRIDQVCLRVENFYLVNCLKQQIF
jgi:hypothetical protein